VCLKKRFGKELSRITVANQLRIPPPVFFSERQLWATPIIVEEQHSIDCVLEETFW
jgi:hypothetical protein